MQDGTPEILAGAKLELIQKELGAIRTTFHGGVTEEGRIEFYEYSRSAYALARLISTVEHFRRTGIVPGRITKSSNIQIYTKVPELGSFSYVTNLISAAQSKLRKSDRAISLDFNALFAWTAGRSLDNMDLFNSNSSAVLENLADVDLSLSEDALPKKTRKAKLDVAATETDNQNADDDSTKRLTKAALSKTRKSQETERRHRISLETDIVVARRARKNLEADPFVALESAKADVKDAEKLAEYPGVRMHDDEARLMSALSSYASQPTTSSVDAAQRAARMSYAANDISPRLNRRLLGDRFVPEEVGANSDALEKLAAKARPLVKDVVLPLRQSATDMDLTLGSVPRKIIHIDEVRGRMISDSVLTRSAFEISVFVIEYNRVTHSGKCNIQTMDVEVPFSLNRKIIKILKDKAIDSLKEEEMTFIARAYLDDGGAIRSLIVEDIA